MDLELREALALAEDRSVAVSQLLPGSEDHDYYRCLHAQHAGTLDVADTILEQWPQRHGHTERYSRMQLRQLLLRVTSAQVGKVADDVRDHFGVSHWHEAEVETTDPKRSTRIADGAFDGETLLTQAIDHDAGLSQVTDEGLLELLDRTLDPARVRVLLGRLGHTAHPGVVKLIAKDLEAKQSGGFGSIALHGQLTASQLLELAKLRPELRGHLGWASAMVQRMVPGAAVDLELDRDARHGYLVTLWTFLADLPPAINSLKAHVLWHLLDGGRLRGTPPDAKLFATYLQLPRNASYVARDYLDRQHRETVAQLGQDFRGVTGLPPAGADEPLVRELLGQLLDRAEQFASWLDRRWLDAEVATARLLHGSGDADRATQTLGPVRAAELRERIELAWCAHNPTRFAADAAVVLEADVKHVSELVVKVFRIDPVAYFQRQHKEVGPDLDLDGLAASDEQVVRIAEPPVRRVRRRIELPACVRPGTYVVDLIGNGISSRAVIHKGRLRQMLRITPAGHLVTIVDEAGVPQPDARAWIGDREYTCDEGGAFVVPFSTAPGRTPALLFCADIASVQDLTLQREAFQLSTTVVLDRESLGAGRTVRALVRARLTIAGAPVSLALIKRATWEITLTDAHGVATTKAQPLALDDHDATVLEWPLGDDTAQISITVRGTVEVRSEQRELELTDARQFEVGTIHRTTSIEALFLARSTAGFVISALGKSGEPRAQRSVTVGVVHRWSRMQLNFELATDARGRVELGALPGVSRITATLGSATQSWWIEDHLGALAIQAAAGQDVTIPIAPSRTATEVARRASLVELRRGIPVHHPRPTIELLHDGLAIRGLAAGDYQLRAPGMSPVTIAVLDVRAELRGVAFTASEVGELSRLAPSIDELEVTTALRLRVRGASPATRVHVIATRFAAKLLEVPSIGPRPVGRRTDRERGTIYVSGRELGDEYRYVLDRRNHKRYPGLLLDRPGLLLNPWSRRTTTTDVATARGGGAFAPAPPRQAAPASAGFGAASSKSVSDEAFASFDFLEAPVVIANLVPDRDGRVEVPLTALGTAGSAMIVIDDRAGMMVRHVALTETPLEPTDLRLKLALDPTRHATQHKQIRPLVSGDRLVIDDLATAKLHLVDTVERAHAYLLALRDDATLREFSFVCRWHELEDGERRERYAKYACHELHLFLYFKDRAFFDEVVAPYLTHKRTKTFLDHWLIGADLTAYLEPSQLVRLNAVERALLAQRLTAEDALARILADEVGVQPPDPLRDTRLVDALLGASTLDGSDEFAALAEGAYDLAESQMEPMPAMEAPMGGAYAPPPPGAPRMKSEEAPKKRKAASRSRRAEMEAEDSDDLDDGDLRGDLGRMQDAPTPHFRTVDKTQEWAEHNWWHRTPADSGGEMIEPNRLWRDLAHHRAGPFLPAGLGLATGSFAEAMCALAVTELPFVAAAHQLTAEGPKLTIVAASHAVVGTSQIVDGELVTTGAPLVVGMSQVRADDRHDWVDGEQLDKYVDGPLATAVVYSSLIVLANPSSSRQRIAALVQIPRGSVAVAGARATQTLDVVLEPYGTHGHEFSFYFPSPGAWTQFPVHVSRASAIVAAAPGRTLEVRAGAAAPDPRSWPYLSQRASLAEVVAFLATANLATIELEKIAWRLRERPAYDALILALERRRAFDATLWGYALLHRDPPRIRVWLRAQAERLLAAGPVLDMIDLDAEALGGYEHLEYAPLVNARAHRLGAKLRILNDGLGAQWTRALELIAHRPAPTAEDLLAATIYLLAQDRIEDALAAFGRIDATAIADRMQHAYVAAYVACLTGDLAGARAHATPWRAHPVDRWRHRFAALLGMLDEVDGTTAGPAVVDVRSREQQHAELASKQPAFDLEVDRDGILVRSQHVSSLELRFFVMDVELLFSRQPFVQSDVSRFSFIEPGHRERLERLAPEHRVAWPAPLRGKNVVVEAVGAGLRKAKVHYANDLATNVSHQVGQLRVTRTDRTALPATYVKVYARQPGGAVKFYKDGYTDLRGWFDYATVSTNDLDHVERFAILVCSDDAGAAILEAPPPAR